MVNVINTTLSISHIIWMFIFHHRILSPRPRPKTHKENILGLKPAVRRCSVQLIYRNIYGKTCGYCFGSGYSARSMYIFRCSSAQGGNRVSSAWAWHSVCGWEDMMHFWDLGLGSKQLQCSFTVRAQHKRGSWCGGSGCWCCVEKCGIQSSNTARRYYLLVWCILDPNPKVNGTRILPLLWFVSLLLLLEHDVHRMKLPYAILLFMRNIWSYRHCSLNNPSLIYRVE